MLTLPDLLLWSWRWLWWFWCVIFRPLWKFPTWLGFNLSNKQFETWGEILGMRYAYSQAWPVFEWLSRRVERNGDSS